MVSSLLVDSLRDPTRSLLEFYESLKDINIDALPRQVSDHFGRIFASEAAFREIPPLDVDNPPESHGNKSLVRFRAMVQDTSVSPEIYLAKTHSGRCGGWGLSDDLGDSGEIDGRNPQLFYENLRECTVVWAVSIPGESSWCREDDRNDAIRNAIFERRHKPLRPYKHPIPGSLHVGVQVKIYDSQSAGSLKSAELHSFVGILTSEALHAESEPGAQANVPTLHVLFTRGLPQSIIPRTFPTSSIEADSKHVREELIQWIAEEGLGGDQQAAEWLLLSIIARVQSRSPPILPPSLTISQFQPPSLGGSSNSGSEPTLLTILSLILPTVTSIPLSLPTINSTSFFPESKDEDLHSGWLQLPPGSLACIWEGGIKEGSINEKGIMNLRAIQELMNTQSLDYVFPYSRFSFPTDVVCVVLSEGSKSTFFQTSINMPLRTQCATPGFNNKLYKPKEEINTPPNSKLERFRAWVGGAKNGNVSIGDTVAEYIQEDFVKERQSGVAKGTKESVTADDLIHRMTVARLLALSMHMTEVTVDIWEKTKLLEGDRKARLI